MRSRCRSEPYHESCVSGYDLQPIWRPWLLSPAAPCSEDLGFPAAMPPSVSVHTLSTRREDAGPKPIAASFEEAAPLTCPLRRRSRRGLPIRLSFSLLSNSEI